MIYVFLADGFEEIEALAPADILRRAGLDVITVGVSGEFATGAHGITVKADTMTPIFDDKTELIILPGGMPGADNLNNSEIVQNAITFCKTENKRIAAICAAPYILGEADLLYGKKAVCFPGFESHLNGAEILSDVGVVTDGLITTAKSAGHAIAFGIELVRLLCGAETADKISFSLSQL